MQGTSVGVVNGEERAGQHGDERWHERKDEEETEMERLGPLLPSKAPAIRIWQHAAADDEHEEEGKLRRARATERMRAARPDDRDREKQRSGEGGEGWRPRMGNHAPVNRMPVIKEQWTEAGRKHTAERKESEDRATLVGIADLLACSG